MLQLLFTVFCFGLAVIPVWRLTRPAAAIPSPTAVADFGATPAAAATTTLDLEADFAPAPASFTVRAGEQTVFAGNGPGTKFQQQWSTVLPKEGVDLVFEVHGVPADADPNKLCAARLIVRTPDGTATDKSFWAAPGSQIEQVVTVPGAGASPNDAPAP